jgi:cytochrome c-type biogenesis protein CcmH
MSRCALRLALIALLVGCASAPSALAAARPSLTDIEQDVMCPSCREPLAVAQSPQANSERAYIRKLIAEGLTKQQIEQNLVGQYGTAVLGRPPASGFNLTIYVLPPAIVLAGVAILAVTLPRWRRRTRSRAADAEPPALTPAPDPVETARLDHELSEFRG